MKNDSPKRTEKHESWRTTALGQCQNQQAFNFFFRANRPDFVLKTSILSNQKRETERQSLKFCYRFFWPAEAFHLDSHPEKLSF